MEAAVFGSLTDFYRTVLTEGYLNTRTDYGRQYFHTKTEGHLKGKENDGMISGLDLHSRNPINDGDNTNSV